MRLRIFQLAGSTLLAAGLLFASSSWNAPVAQAATRTDQVVSHLGSLTITCTYSVQNPHQSSTPGFRDRWNVHATWKCQGSAGVSNVVTLRNAPHLIQTTFGDLGDGRTATYPPDPSSGMLEVHGQSSSDNYSNGPCRQGFAGEFDLWTATATGFVQFPPGFTPASGTVNVSSPSFAQLDMCGPGPDA